MTTCLTQAYGINCFATVSNKCTYIIKRKILCNAYNSISWLRLYNRNWINLTALNHSGLNILIWNLNFKQRHKNPFEKWRRSRIEELILNIFCQLFKNLIGRYWRLYAVVTQCAMWHSTTWHTGAQNRDQNPKIGIPSVLGKAAQTAAQRSMSVSSPPWSSGAKIKSKQILTPYLIILFRLNQMIFY